MTTSPDKLYVDYSKEQVEIFANGLGIGNPLTLARQLLDTMRENEQLKQNATVFTCGPCPKCGHVTRELVCMEPNPFTVPCTSCGKPMEDRGASKQWCRECSSKIAEGE